MEAPPGFRYIDAHTHQHPPRLFAAIRRWFDEHSDWNLHGPTEPEVIAGALRAAGVERFVFFSYAHRPGMARELNRWLRDVGATLPDGVPLGAVHAEDGDPAGIVEEACVAFGFAGIKLHVQVQRFHPDDPRMLAVYERLQALDRVLVIHVGTGPHPNQFTGIGRLVPVLERFADLRVVVCHMGAFETRVALRLLDRFPSLHLDTTMALTPASLPFTRIDPRVVRDADLVRYADRIVFGSDFPNLPYPYEEERRGLWARDLPLPVYQKIFRDNARRLFRL
ncbi:MAG: amidohydrolase family protein [Candidatus Rokuibacteriota bacterium]